jgi:hypothetical protein
MTLTVGLAILAGVVLLGVVVQGAWAARKVVPRALPELGERQEPSLGEGGAAGPKSRRWPIPRPLAEPAVAGRRPPAAAPASTR